MKLLTVSNLYPRPDRPQAGMFNAQLFRELAALPGFALRQVTLVHEWRVWRWPWMRRWVSPFDGGHPVRYLPVFHVPVIGRSWSAAFCARALHAGLARELREADAVLAAWLYPDGVAAARAARRHDRPCWIMVLGSDVQHLDVAARRVQILEAAQSAAGFICVGRQLAERLTAAGVPRERVHVVPNGVDTALFRPRPREAARQALLPAVPASVRVILFVGNLVPVKNPDLLLRAAATLTGADAPHVVLVGQGPLRGTLERLAAGLGIGLRTHSVGSCAHAQVAQWMNAADCLCLCSRSEGMPNVVLEALAAGLPVAATDVGTCRDMLAGETTARVVPPGDAAALASALRALLTLPADRSKMASDPVRRSWRDQARDVWKLVEGSVRA